MEIYAIIKVLPKNKDHSDCKRYRAILFFAHVGILLKILASRLSDYCEARGSPSGTVRLPSYTINNRMLAMRRLQELGQDEKTHLYMLVY